MKRNTVAVVLCSAISALLLNACNPSFISEQNAKKFSYVTATADGGYSLTMEQLYRDMYASHLAEMGGIIDTQSVRQYRDSLVADTLTGLDARSVSLEDNYDQYRLFRLRYYDLLVRTYLQKEVYDKVTLDSTETVDYYNSHPEIFTVEEHINLFHILISPTALPATRDSLKYEGLSKEQLDDAAQKLAFEIHARIHDSTSFVAEAKEFSHDTTTGNNGGFVGWTGHGVYLDPFDSVAFALRAGDISQPYRDANGWHILYCQAYVPKGLQPLNPGLYEAAATALRNERTNIIGRALTDSLFGLMKVRYNEPLLDTNLFLVDGRQWLAIVNERDTIDCNDARSTEIAIRQKLRIDNTTPELKKDMYNRLGQRFALAEAAIDTRLDTLAEVRQQQEGLKHKYRRVIIDKRRYDPDWQPSDSLIEAYYDAHKDDFKVEKPLVVQQIVTKDSVLGEFVRDQAMGGVDFLSLAKQYYPGEENIREALADLGPIGERDVSPEFWQAAVSTPIGEVSHPVKTEFGYQIIKVLDRKQSQDLPKARTQIIEILKDKHRELTFDAYRTEIFQRYNVQLTGETVSGSPEAVSG